MGKLGPWSVDETQERNGEMCVGGREEVSEVKEEEEKALEVATGDFGLNFPGFGGNRGGFGCCLPGSVGGFVPGDFRGNLGHLLSAVHLFIVEPARGSISVERDQR